MVEIFNKCVAGKLDPGQRLVSRQALSVGDSQWAVTPRCTGHEGAPFRSRDSPQLRAQLTDVRRAGAVIVRSHNGMMRWGLKSPPRGGRFSESAGVVHTQRIPRPGIAPIRNRADSVTDSRIGGVLQPFSGDGLHGFGHRDGRHFPQLCVPRIADNHGRWRWGLWRHRRCQGDVRRILHGVFSVGLMEQHGQGDGTYTCLMPGEEQPKGAGFACLGRVPARSLEVPVPPNDHLGAVSGVRVIRVVLCRKTIFMPSHLPRHRTQDMGRAWCG